ncbi:MAG: hypothetical protein AAF990_03270 [Bacteroidota bacterium]
MKASKLLFLLLTSIYFFGCTNTTPTNQLPYDSIPKQPHLVRIQGQVSHLQDDFSRRVRLLDDPIGSGFPMEIAIDTLEEDGRFTLSTQLDRPREIFFEFNDRWITLLVAPGDSFQLNFPADYYNGLHQVYPTLKVSGKGALKNELMFAFLNRFNRRFDNNTQLGQRWMMDEEEYLQFWAKAEMDQNNFLDSFLLTQPQSSPAFEQWARHKIYYDITFALQEYPQMRKNRRKDAMPLTRAYKDRLKSRKLTDPTAVGSRAYLRAIESCRIDMLKRSPSIFFTSLPMTPISSNDVRRELKKLQNQTTPLLREYLSAQYMDCLLEQDHWHSLQPHYEDVLSTFADTTVRTYLERKRHHLYDTLNLPKPSPQVQIRMVHPQQPLDQLFEKYYKGKIICLTQWNTYQPQWGLKNLPAAQKACKEVAFVYIAHHSPPAQWYRKLTSDDYPGDHFLLSNETYMTIDSLFFHNDRRYPHLLIDRDGIIQQGQNWLFGRHLIKALKKLSNQ